MTGAGKIDVHAHYLPDSYRDALARRGHAQPDGIPGDPGRGRPRSTWR